MRIPLTVPRSPRYIHINPTTNKVHLLVPIVGGLEISTDNTCEVLSAIKKFFEGDGLRELKAYKEALVADIALFETTDELRTAKEAKLVQIEAYIGAVSAMRFSYGAAMTFLLNKPSNLYSIQLRPSEQDPQSYVVNPVFNVNRKNDATGTSLSSLFNAMHSVFPTLQRTRSEPRTQLTTAVINALPTSASFEDIQQVLGEQSLALFGLTLDFKQRTDGTPATKEAIDALMGFAMDTTVDEYIDALLGACTSNVWETLPTPPFYSIPPATPTDERVERLSIMTQFFLANLNVYCKARGLSAQNFGYSRCIIRVKQ